ncbi:MAG: hypothetical protein LBF22_03850 [Deltaproteobacteria bacterium]|jgi:transposase|nr:hypothetical protein [Deltaproteobacteria bacterium]
MSTFPKDLERLQRNELFLTIESQAEILVLLKKMSLRDVKRHRIYFSIYLKEDGSKVFERNYSKIDELTKNCGIFCLLTNTGLDAQEVLSKYRRKDMIEKGFDDIKNHIDTIMLKTHHTETTEGNCSVLLFLWSLQQRLGPNLGF